MLHGLDTTTRRLSTEEVGLDGDDLKRQRDQPIMNETGRDWQTVKRERDDERIACGGAHGIGEKLDPHEDGAGRQIPGRLTVTVSGTWRGSVLLACLLFLLGSLAAS